MKKLSIATIALLGMAVGVPTVEASFKDTLHRGVSSLQETGKQIKSALQKGVEIGQKQLNETLLGKAVQAELRKRGLDALPQLRDNNAAFKHMCSVVKSEALKTDLAKATLATLSTELGEMHADAFVLCKYAKYPNGTKDLNGFDWKPLAQEAGLHAV